jgi:dsDNA-specific endonuclease/ATPase MutS2
MGIWEIWGLKAIKAIKGNGRDGLFNYFRDFAKYVVENIRKEEELKAFLAHNLKHVKGYSVEEFNEELKKEIIHNINNSFKWDGSDSYETYGSVKRAYGDWDEFFLILKEAFETIHRLLHYFRNKSDEETFELKRIFEGIADFPDEIEAIEHLVDRFGNVRDSASEELRQIRREIAVRQGQVAKRIQRILLEAQKAGIVSGGNVASVSGGSVSALILLAKSGREDSRANTATSS